MLSLKHLLWIAYTIAAGAISNQQFNSVGFKQVQPTVPNEYPTSLGKWTNLEPIALYPRQEHTAVAINSTHLYILGGIVPELNGSIFPTVAYMQVYSILDNKWSSVAPIPIALNHPNAAVVDGKIYLLGGLTPRNETIWVASPRCHVYDPRFDKWTELENMPDGRGSAAMGVQGNTIYLAGGQTYVDIGPGNWQDTVKNVSSYNTLSRKWTTLPPLPFPRDHAGTALIEHTFYVLGGRAFGNENVVDTVLALDVHAPTLEWTSNRARMPTPRGGCSSAVLNGKIYTFGGEGNPVNGKKGVFNQTEAYDPKADCWSTLTPMAVPRHGTYAVAVFNKIYIAGGGVVQGGAPVDTFDYFSL